MNRREWRNVIVTLAVTAIIVISGAYALANVRTSRDKAICHQIELIKSRIRDSIGTNLRTLPTIEYYQTHPKELTTALNDAKATLRAFAPGCAQ